LLECPYVAEGAGDELDEACLWRWCFEVGAPEAEAAGADDAPGVGDADPNKWKLCFGALEPLGAGVELLDGEPDFDEPERD
jgi:hypothetical protein